MLKNRSDGLITVREAMLLLDIRTRHEFNKLILHKKLPCTMIGKHIWISPDDVERYVAASYTPRAPGWTHRTAFHER